MKEIVVISGKGGTGKTSLVASFAALARNAVLADCDVDAADLHLLLAPRIRERGRFSGSRRAEIRQAACEGCGACLARCRFDAVKMKSNNGDRPSFTIDPAACEGCGVCVAFCPLNAIDFNDRESGEWFVSETRFGPMVHARLGVAEENSGNLVTFVRGKARQLALETNADWIIIDGPPGIGCPVIASLSGATLAVIVTEPTRSASHDLNRVVELAAHFKVAVVICMNKCDLNRDEAGRMEKEATAMGIPIAGMIPYDDSFTQAQLREKALIEYQSGPLADELRNVWNAIVRTTEQQKEIQK